MKHNTRRHFLKVGAAGATSIAVSGAGSLVKAKATAWKQINPAIDNLRVVVANDSAMTTGDAAGRLRIHENLNKMARALAQKSTSEEAWQTIFQKSPSKRWSDLEVKIKTNCIEPAFIPRAEIIEKICMVLNSINSSDASDPGVPFNRITVFDNQDCSGYNGKLPSGVNIGGNFGSPDIFINVAVNKGHEQSDKQFTLTSKNYYGVFGSGSGPQGCGDMSYLLGLVKRDEIMGGNPIRCQLNIVDALWSMIGGPTAWQGYDTTKTDRIAMGTLGPVVDFLVAWKIRNNVMNQNHDSGIINRYMDDFDYSAEKGSLDFVDALNVAPQAATPTILPVELGFSDSVEVSLECATPGATIYYTTDGGAPTNGSTQYSAPFAIIDTTTIRAVAYANGVDPSDIASATFTKIAMRDPEDPSNTSAGLKYSYYEASVSSVDEIGSLTPTATGTSATVSNSVALRSDNYALAFEGFISITTAGVYTFSVSADDAAALYIGDTKVVECQWSDGDTGQSGTIGLNAGKHALKVLHYQGGGGVGLSASVAGASMSKQEIPASMLYQLSGATAGNLTRQSDGRGVRAQAVGRNQISVAVNLRGRHVCSVIRADGREVAVRKGTGSASYRINQGVSPGTYVVKVDTDGKSVVRQVTVGR